MPTPTSEIPITVMIVPVTTGGNSGSSRLTKGAIRIVNIPATMVAP
jgi:hypothetical protein